MLRRFCLAAIFNAISRAILSLSFIFVGSLATASDNPGRPIGPVKYPVLPKVDTCLKSCIINADCGIGGLCSNKTCTYEKQYCANERWAVNARGESTDCKAYTCDSNKGLCRREAQASEDCSPGYAYDGNKSCVLSIQCDPKIDPGCQPLLDKWQKTRDQWEATFPQPNPKVFSCLKCTRHSECVGGNMCWQGRCVADSLYCDALSSIEQGSYQKAGLVQACQTYSCEKVSGECLNSCIQNTDCAVGNICDKFDGRCKAPPITPP